MSRELLIGIACTMIRRGFSLLLVLAFFPTVAACGGQTPAVTEGVTKQIPIEDLAQAVIGEELIVGDTKVLVTDANPLESIEADMGFGPSKVTLNEPGMLFLDVKMTISNLRDENGVLEGEKGKDSIFMLVGGDGKACGAFGYLSDPAMGANETRDITKTFAVHQDAVEGAKLYVKDIFSDQRGAILLSKSGGG